MENDGPTPQKTKDQEYKGDSSGTGNEVQTQLINIKSDKFKVLPYFSISPHFMLHQGECGGSVTIYNSKGIDNSVLYYSVFKF